MGLRGNWLFLKVPQPPNMQTHFKLWPDNSPRQFRLRIPLPSPTHIPYDYPRWLIFTWNSLVPTMTISPRYLPNQKLPWVWIVWVGLSVVGSVFIDFFKFLLYNTLFRGKYAYSRTTYEDVQDYFQWRGGWALSCPKVELIRYHKFVVKRVFFEIKSDTGTLNSWAFLWALPLTIMFLSITIFGSVVELQYSFRNTGTAIVGWRWQTKLYKPFWLWLQEVYWRAIMGCRPFLLAAYLIFDKGKTCRVLNIKDKTVTRGH